MFIIYFRNVLYNLSSSTLTPSEVRFHNNLVVFLHEIVPYFSMIFIYYITFLLLFLLLFLYNSKFRINLGDDLMALLSRPPRQVPDQRKDTGEFLCCCFCARCCVLASVQNSISLSWGRNHYQ